MAGFVGEQFALPEAVDALRAVRRQRDDAETLIVTAADPLNLVGILTPGARVAPHTHQVIAYRAGVPAAVGPPAEVLPHLRRQGALPGPGA